MLMVIFVVFMIFWFIGGGYYAYQPVPGGAPGFNPIGFGASTLIPWICVAILGWVVFNGHGPSIPMR